VAGWPPSGPSPGFPQPGEPALVGQRGFPAPCSGGLGGAAIGVAEAGTLHAGERTDWPSLSGPVTRWTIISALICGGAAVVTDACLDAVQAAHASGKLGWLTKSPSCWKTTLRATQLMKPCGSGFGGAEHEIDLSKKNAAAFRTKLTRSLNTPAQQGKGQPTGRRVPRQAVSAAPISGPGRRPTASWSASAGSIPASVVEQYHATIKRP
jgi:hypothetical protein